MTLFNFLGQLVVGLIKALLPAILAKKWGQASARADMAEREADARKKQDKAGTEAGGVVSGPVGNWIKRVRDKGF